MSFDNPRDWSEHLADSGRSDAELVVQLLLLSKRFAVSADAAKRFEAADVLWSFVSELSARGANQAARRIAEEIGARFAEDQSFRVRSRVVAALSYLGALDASSGRIGGALERYDQALAMVSASPELRLHAAGVAIYLQKGKLLAGTGRLEEASFEMDNALRALEGATAGNFAVMVRQAAVATVSELECLLLLERGAEAGALEQQLRALLGDMAGDASPRSPVPEPQGSSESELAKALAGAVNDDRCLDIFESGERGTLLRPDAVDRALRLYTVSDPWTYNGTPPRVIDAAAMLIRRIADGYALLSANWSREQLHALPLPRRADVESEALNRLQDVAEWAESEGYPLELGSRSGRGSSDRPAETTVVVPTDIQAASAGLVGEMSKCLFVFGFANALSEWELGLAALRDKVFAGLAISYLRFSSEWQVKLSSERVAGGIGGASAVLWLMAQQLYVATHRRADDPVPPLDQASMRNLLHQAGGHGWLVEHGAVLPSWVA